MNRRAFLFGTVLSLAAPVVARSGTLGVNLGPLRGSIDEAIVSSIAADDRSAALQAAINRATRAGRPLYLGPGRYEVSNINLPDGCRIVGVPGRTVVVYAGGGRLFHCDGGRTLAIDGLSIDGCNRALADDDDGLLSLAFVEDVRLDRIEVIGSSGHGIALARSSGRVNDCRVSGARGCGIVSTEGDSLTIADSTVADSRGGIHLRRWTPGDDGSTLSGNRLTGIGGAAIRLSGAGNVRISGNDIRTIAGPAIIADALSPATAVSDNAIDGASLGIALCGGSDARLSLVDGNRVRNIVGSGNAVLTEGRADGVGIHLETHGTLTGNAVETVSRLGLSLGWGATLGNVVASGNVIRAAAAGIGVSVMAPDAATVVTGNLLVGVPDGAVRGMRYADYATDDLTRVGAATIPGLVVGDNRVA